MKQFTNAQLIAEFERVFEQCVRCDWEPDLKARLEDLSFEIRCRERLGNLGEEDWMLPRH